MKTVLNFIFGFLLVFFSQIVSTNDIFGDTYIIDQTDKVEVSELQTIQ